MKLYEIDEQLERLLLLPDGNSVDTETGEVFSADAIAELNMERDTKIENCLLFSKNQSAEAEAIKAEIDALTKRMKVCTNNAERAKKFAQGFLGGEKFKTPKVAVSYRDTPVVKVNCEVLSLPEEFIRTKITQEADKVALKKALQGGAKIEGVELAISTTMSVK